MKEWIETACIGVRWVGVSADAMRIQSAGVAEFELECLAIGKKAVRVCY